MAIYPERSTASISLAVDGTIWQYVPPNLTEIASVGGGQTPSLGAAVAVTPTTILTTVGWWVVSHDANVCVLVNSNGTTTVAGFTGEAYHLTWS